MDPLPLVVGIFEKDVHSLCFVLRECFQDVLTRPVLPDNILKNTKKYNLTNKILKDSSDNIDLVIKNSELAIRDLEKIEIQLMANHAFYILRSSYIDSDPWVKEKVKLLQTDMTPNFSPDIIEKYGFIQKADFDICKPEKAIDFRYNKGEQCVYSKVYETKIYKYRIRKGKQTSVGKKLETLFKAYPETIVFTDYDINKTYKKKLKLKNITNKTRALYFKKYPTNKNFQLEAVSQYFRFAPGMSAVFNIYFKPDTLLDTQDTVIFDTYTGASIKVQLICYRSAPCLRTYVFKGLDNFMKKPMPYCDSSIDYDVYRSLALNTVVDCGSCLLGNRIDLSLIMQNEGSRGLFFIMSENEWFNAEINNVSTSLGLTLNSFHLQPTYFKVEKKEFVEVNIEYFPLTTGLHIEYLYILCDNNTFEKVDLIGDGVSFSINMIGIKVPSKLKTFLHHDSNSEYFLYLGPFLPYHKLINTFTVENLSCLDFKYRWEIRKSVTHFKDTILKTMCPDWIEINPKSHLLGYSQTDFVVTINCKTFDTGLYSIVLMLIIEDIPEVALEDDYMFEVFDKINPTNEVKHDLKMVDVIVCQLEIAVDLFPYNVEIFPEIYNYPSVLRYKQKAEDTVRVMIAGTLSVECKWEIQNESKDYININPISFTLKPGITVDCVFVITAFNYKNIDETIDLVIGDNALIKKFKVRANIEKPMVEFTTHNLYFGIIPRGKPYTSEFTIVSKSYEAIDWLIMELFYDEKRQKFYEVKSKYHLNITSGQMCSYNEKMTIVYKLNTTRDIHWCSFLILISSHPTLTAMKSMCIVNYQVLTPHVEIHTISSDFPILCPDKLLHKDIRMQSKILIQNCADITACFIWGKHFGPQAEYMNVSFSPKSGVLPPKKGAYVDVYITPLKLGLFEDIYVPCFVGRVNYPIILRILCAVEDVYVNFLLPKSDGSFETVFWPPQMVDELEMQVPDFEYNESQFEQEKEHKCYCEGILKYKCACKESNNVNIGSPDALSDVITKYLGKKKKTTGVMEEACSSDHLSQLTFNTERSESYCSYCPDNLRNYISKNLRYLDHVVECFKVPIRTLVKRTIYIENLTPASGTIDIEPSNFYGADISKKSKIMGTVLYDLKIKKTCKWDDIMNDDGVLVEAVPSNTKINGHETIEIDICVYATTWGVYLEEITIDINDILPFCFNVLIEVVGNPIQFPIAVNTILSEPIFRFGTFPYKSGTSKRSIKVVNTSDISLHVVWHIFIHNPRDDDINTKNYFNVLFELLQSNQQSDLNVPSLEGKIIVTRDYYGKRNSKIFQLNCTETDIERRGFTTVDVVFDASYFDSSFDKTEIEAYLIGFIHLSDNQRFQPELLRRPTGNEIEPAKIKITANVEIPILKLDYTVDDMRIEIDANTVVNQNVITRTKQYSFSNNSGCTILISMDIEPPFQVVSLKTSEVCDENYTSIHVKNGENVEATIKCTISSEKVVDLSSMLYAEDSVWSYGTPDLVNYSINIKRYLNIKQCGILEQNIPMELVIFYPQLSVTPLNLDYGMTYIGCSNRNSITLINNSAHDLPFIVCTVLTSENVIICRPNKGVLPTNGSIEVHIFFKPKEVRLYQDTVRILTNLRTYYFDVTVQGMGTTNEKFLTH